MTERQNRPLDRVYPVVFIDGAGISFWIFVFVH